MTKHQIIERIMGETGLPKMVVSAAVESIMKTISQAVIEGDTVYLRGFGKFFPVTRKPKSVRNFRTEENYSKQECRYPKFRPYDSFINAVNNGHYKK
jgi:DNA-binding protein HU-beta